jgi:hypothetical protein
MLWRLHQLYRNPLLLGAGFLLLLVGFAAWLFLFHDAPDPDDAHMLPAPALIHVESNALAQYVAATNHMPIKGMEAVASSPADPFAEPDLRNPKNLKEHFLRTDLEEAAAIAAFRELSYSDASTWKWPYPQFNPPQARRMARVHALDVTSGYLLAKCPMLAASDKTAEAVELALLVFRVNHRATLADLTSDQYGSSLGTQHQSLEVLSEVLSGSGVTPELLRTTLNTLNSHVPANLDAYTHARKSAYEHFKRLIKDAVVNDTLERHLRISWYAPLRSRFTPLTLTLKPNATLHLRLEMEDRMSDALKAGWSSAAKSALDEIQRSREVLSSLGTWRAYIDANHGGKWAHHRCIQEDLDTLFDLLGLQDAYEVIRINLALRVLELRSGRLPNVIAELTPDTFSSTPVLLSTGDAIQWNRSKCIIHLPGADLDQNAAEIKKLPHSRSDGYHFTSTYWWNPRATQSE